MKKITLLVAAIAILGGSLVADSLEQVRKAPELTFTIPSEGQKTLSQYRGKVVALEFIWTTCPHCQAASRVMTKLQQEYGPRGFQALDIAVNQNADLLVENFAKEYEVGFPVGWITQPQMVSFMNFSSDRFVVPQLVLIDRKGYIHYQSPQTEDEKWDKLMKEGAIRQHIEQLLSLSKPEHLSSQASAAKKGR